MPRSMHAQLARRAAEEGVSQNHLIIAYVSAGLAGGAWKPPESMRVKVTEAKG